MEFNQRTYWIDALKFFSMLIVFFCHLNMSFSYLLFSNIKLGKVVFPNFLTYGKLAVSMFLLLSVMLAVKKSFDNKFNSFSFLEFCVKRFLRLFIPVLVINVLILIIYLLNLFCNQYLDLSGFVHGKEWFVLGSPKSAIFKTVFASLLCCFSSYCINPPCWTIYLLFLLPILSVLITQIVTDKQILFYLSLAISPFLFIVKSYALSIALILIILLSDEKFIKRKLYLFISTTIFFVFLFILFIRCNFIIDIVDKYEYPINMIFAASILNLFYQRKEKNILNYKVFSVLNRCSFGIYLLHMPVICVIGYVIYIKSNNLFFSVISITITMIILSILFYLIVEKKFTKFITEFFLSCIHNKVKKEKYIC